MKILAVTPWVPTTRRPRSRRLLTFLSESHDVHLVCAAWSEAEAAEAEGLPVPSTIVRLSPVRGILGAGIALLSGTSLQQGYVSSRRFARTIRSAALEFQPDAFYFNVIRSAQLVQQVRGLPGLRVIDLDELRSRYYELMRSRSRNLLWRLVASFENVRMGRAEEEARADFDRVLFSSPRDVERWPEVSRLVRSPVSLELPSDASEEVDTKPVDIAGRPYILFVGRLGYRANAEAIVWFAREVWPAVSSQFPDLQLYVVGEAPGRAIRALASDSVHVTGRVPSVAPYYESALACIVPVTMATGVQLKLVEAMTAGRLSVVTPVVADGAGVTDQQEVLVADPDPAAWIDLIMRVVDDQAQFAGIAFAGQKWVRTEYPDKVIRKALLDAFSAARAEGTTKQ